MSSGGGSFCSVSVQAGAGGRTWCHIYEDRTPVLAVDAGASSVSVRGRTADKAAVGFTRALADAAQQFAAEIGRMHAAQLGNGGSKADDKAA